MTMTPRSTANASPTKLSLSSADALTHFAAAARELRATLATDAHRSLAAGPPVTLLVKLREIRGTVSFVGAAS